LGDFFLIDFIDEILQGRYFPQLGYRFGNLTILFNLFCLDYLDFSKLSFILVFSMSLAGKVIETLFLLSKGVLPGSGETDDSYGSDYISSDRSDDEKAQADSITDSNFWSNNDR
jgi:hypothetical protein